MNTKSYIYNNALEAFRQELDITSEKSNKYGLSSQ